MRSSSMCLIPGPVVEERNNCHTNNALLLTPAIKWQSAYTHITHLGTRTNMLFVCALCWESSGNKPQLGKVRVATSQHRIRRDCLFVT